MHNEKKQNALHFCCIFGAKECLKYLIKFDFLDPNEEDNFGKIPLEYLIENHNEENDDNKIMLVHLLMKTNLNSLKIKEIPNFFNIWQNNIFLNFFKSPAVKFIVKDN